MDDTRRWQQVMAVFEAATQWPAGERAARLDAACAGDDSLRREVEALLAHDVQAPADFLQPPEPPADLRAWLADDGEMRLGQTIAGYRLVEVLDSGGMGTVYRARQEKLQRDVAVKIVRPGLAAASALKRFEHEARFLARLRHPHIAQIYEAGTFRDPATGATTPYFVMELVEGAQPITRYCGAGAAPGGRTPEAKFGAGGARKLLLPTGVGGSEPLPLRARLKLFGQVCEAVHHGHQRGLIHRDLKPGNILVDAQGNVKVIDFGVARSTDADMAVTTLQTDSGQLVGTMQYMSPEQCAADVADLDVRSDVYALGMVLYELVCGQLPYSLNGATLYTAARIVCEQPPAPPRACDAAMARDLEAILLKCLEKDRARRYPSAAQLGEDIQRYLAGDTVTARAPGLYRKTMRWVARHAIAATAIACAAMIALTVAGLLIGVKLAARQPNKLYISMDGDQMWLENLAGLRHGAMLRGPKGKLHGWPRLVDHNGRQLAIVGVASNVNDPLEAGLYAFDAEAGLTREGVEWHCTVAAQDIPSPPADRRDRPDYGPENFWITSIRLIDVFPEVPGPEIISTWAHEMYSWRALRIHDLDGVLRYQLWHDGNIGHDYMRWLPDAGLLVLAGQYCTHDPWVVVPELEAAPHIRSLLVVFAVRPKRDQIETKLISVPEREEWRSKSAGRDTAKGPRSAPEWYKFVWPLHRVCAIQFESINPSYARMDEAHSDAQATVAIEFVDAKKGEPGEPGGIRGNLHWKIDQFGETVPNTHVMGDTYRQLRDAGHALPPAGHFRLVDLETLIADPFGEMAYGSAPDAAEGTWAASGTGRAGRVPVEGNSAP